jgi:hypothetical protein
VDRKRRVNADLTGLSRPVRSWPVGSWSIVLAAGALLLLLTAGLLSGAPLSNNLDWWVIGGGGNRITITGGNVLQGTLGQPVTGASQSGSGSLCAGFWCDVSPDYLVYLPVVQKGGP